ncbi:peptidoglycan-binding protein [Streptococcus salivarius]|jgi:LPXTG-motif cell wall-anchored protein|uniref:VWA domain-containing protein n=1 Tax=Streptococcus TaxID=1301 RepID=UPI0008A19708|nr:MULTISPECIES: VWA domain-containing protein [Streptococcus]OFS45804.1 peptidoglycan-binding protein [Streptococcus sp. HMSC072D03]PCR83100.1 peptidoglycan-binding protein [Streptococcus salivarius]
MEKQIRFRKQSLILSSVALATIFAGTAVSADETATTTPATPATTTEAAPQSTTAQIPIAKATEEIKAKANTPVIPLENAKVGDVVGVDVKATEPTVTAKESTDGTEAIATATSTEETDEYVATTTETVNKTTVVEVVKEADVVNRQEVKGTTDIVFIVDKSGSMDSHITDVANNIEKFVRDLESKNVQARLGLVDYESSKDTTYHDFGGSKFTTDTNAFIGKLKAIRTTGSDEEATTALSHIATSPDYTWGTGKNNRRFAFLVTDEDIDLTPKKPTKDATLKALQDAGISLTVVGKKYDEKDFDPLVKGTNGLYLDIDKDFADLLNKQFSNYVIETVQEGRVYRIQTDTYEVIATTHLVTKATNQPETVQPATPTVPGNVYYVEGTVYEAPTPLQPTYKELPETGSSQSAALVSLGLINAALGLGMAVKPKRN